MGRAEAVEEIDLGPQEVLRTSGANRPQIVANATLPMVVLVLIITVDLLSAMVRKRLSA